MEQDNGAEKILKEIIVANVQNFVKIKKISDPRNSVNPEHLAYYSKLLKHKR